MPKDPHNKKAPGEAAAHAKFYYTKYSAKKRGIEWDLSEEQFRAISKQTCNYCGAEPTAKYLHKNYNGPFVHNGIDRVENTKSYVFTNCIACCSDCNYAKNDRDPLKFCLWVVQVYNYLKLEKLTEGATWNLSTPSRQ